MLAELLDAGKCTTLREGRQIRLRVRAVYFRGTRPADRVEIVALNGNGSPIWGPTLDDTHLQLSRSTKHPGAWVADHVHLMGAPANLGIATALLDFAQYECGFRLVETERLDRGGEEARTHFAAWKLLRETTQSLPFFNCAEAEE